MLRVWMMVAAVLLAAGAQAAEVAETDRKVYVQTPRSTIETRGIGSEYDARVREAQHRVRAGDADGARAILREVIALYQQAMNTPQIVYVSVSDDAQFEDAIKAHPEARVERVSHGLQEALFLQGFLLAGEERYDEAEEVLTKALAWAPYDANLYLERAYVRKQQGRYAEALADFEQVRTLAEKYKGEAHTLPAAWRGIAFAQVELGDLDAALAAIDQALALAPDNEQAQKEREYILHQQERR